MPHKIYEYNVYDSTFKYQAHSELVLVHSYIIVHAHGNIYNNTAVESNSQAPNLIFASVVVVVGGVCACACVAGGNSKALYRRGKTRST